jgi:hypothetical protein
VPENTVFKEIFGPKKDEVRGKFMISHNEELVIYVDYLLSLG